MLSQNEQPQQNKTKKADTMQKKKKSHATLIMANHVLHVCRNEKCLSTKTKMEKKKSCFKLCHITKQQQLRQLSQ